jgi:hypothetical protein
LSARKQIDNSVVRLDHMRQRQRPRVVDRLELRFSTGRRIDGVWVGVAFSFEPEPILHRVEEALRLIQKYDRLRYNRLIRDLERIWVRDVPGALGSFDHSLHACSLDREFVLAERSCPELIAATIVHEATHARLDRCGISYEEELRPKVEAACFRRELAFAAKLPNGEQVREQAERKLAFYATQEYWTNAAFAERYVKDHIEALRSLGARDWIGRTALILRAARLRVRYFVQGVARFTRRR